MKKTIKINLNGLVFHIDEDAYEMLKRYLEQLHDRFRGTAGEKEIMSDIEARLAELFQGNISDEKEAVNVNDVSEAIGILGEPEEIGEMVDDEEVIEEEPTRVRGARRVYRNADHRIIGGVCTGLGEYLRIDPVIIRILFIVFTLTYGVGLLIYLLLWIAIPEARTRSEKLEMRGEIVNIASIERSVRNEYDTIKRRYRRKRRSSSEAISDSDVSDVSESDEPREPVRRRHYHRPRHQRNEGGFLYVIGQIMLVFFKIIAGIIGFAFVMAGVSLLVLLIGTLITGSFWFDEFGWNLHGFNLGEMMDLFVDETVGIIASICLLILIAVPVLGLVYGGVKLLFRFRANDKAVVLSCLASWFIALLVLVVVGVTEGAKYSTSGRTETEQTLVMPESESIYLMAGEEPEDLWDDAVEINYRSEIWMTSGNGQLQLVGHPRIDVVQSLDGTATMRITKRARGANLNMARTNARKVKYDYSLKDTLLLVDRVFQVPHGSKFHAQEVDIEIEIPVGTKLFLDESLRNLLYSIDNTDDRWSRHMVGEAWIMTRQGLSPVEE